MPGANPEPDEGDDDGDRTEDDENPENNKKTSGRKRAAKGGQKIMLGAATPSQQEAIEAFLDGEGTLENAPVGTVAGEFLQSYPTSSSLCPRSIWPPVERPDWRTSRSAGHWPTSVNL